LSRDDSLLSVHESPVGIIRSEVPGMVGACGAIANQWKPAHCVA